MSGYQLQTTDDLLTAFKAESYIPASQGNFDDPQLLGVADRLLLKYVFPLLKRLGHGWYLGYTDVTLLTTTTLYALPRYAMAGIVHSCELVDATTGAKIRDIYPSPRIQADVFESSSTGTPSHFELVHNLIRLNRLPATADTTNYRLRVWHYRRPGRMIPIASANKVQSVNSGTGVVTYTATLVSGFTSSSAHDFYRGESPFHRLGANVAATAAGASTQTFSLTNAALLQVDDYVCLRDETVFPDLPIELYPHLIDLMDYRLCRSKGDAQQFALAAKDVVAGMQSAVESAPGARVKMPAKLSVAKSGLLGGMSRGSKLVGND